jgi:hypothetical protein
MVSLGELNPQPIGVDSATVITNRVTQDHKAMQITPPTLGLGPNASWVMEVAGSISLCHHQPGVSDHQNQILVTVSGQRFTKILVLSIFFPRRAQSMTLALVCFFV